MENISRAAKAVLEKIEAAGFEGYLVGGCVRDLLRGQAPHDWDMTTSARPEQIAALFEGYAIPTGLKHGTITVRSGDEFFEVTTYRRDGAYGDHRRPDRVEFTASLEEDLARRDFTINAMAMSLRGELKDPFGGEKDLKEKSLRCVGNPTLRFQEDALRILRALRFSATLGFPIREETAAAARAQRELLQYVSGERCREEMYKLLCGENVLDVLLRYPEIIGVVLPEILPSVGLDQCNKHHCYTVWEHTARAVAAARPDPVLRMTLLLHDLGKPACMTFDSDGTGHFRGHAEKSVELAREVMHRLRFGNEEKENILRLVEWHDHSIAPTEKSIRRALAKLGQRDLRILLEVKRADNLAQAPEYRNRQQEIDTLEKMLDAVLAKGACFQRNQMAVNGRDLMSLGISGRALGDILNRLLAEVIDGTLPNEREILMARARQLMQ